MTPGKYCTEVTTVVIGDLIQTVLKRHRGVKLLLSGK